MSCPLFLPTIPKALAVSPFILSENIFFRNRWLPSLKTLILCLLGATVFFLRSVPRLFILLFWLVLSPLQWRHSTKGLHHLLHTELQTTNTHIQAHLLLRCLPRRHPWISGGVCSSTCLKLNSTTSFQVCISSQTPNQGQMILDTILSFIFSPKSFINSTGSTECLVCVGAGHWQDPLSALNSQTQWKVLPNHCTQVSFHPAFHSHYHPPGPSQHYVFPRPISQPLWDLSEASLFKWSWNLFSLPIL